MLMGSVKAIGTMNHLYDNWIQFIILLMGTMLLKLSILSYFSSRKLSQHYEEVKRRQMTCNAMVDGHYLLASTLGISFFLFGSFLYLSFWFIFFSSGPASNIQAIQTRNTEGSEIVEVLRSYSRPVVVFLGFLYGMVTYILYIELHLMKKILKKLEEINLFVQMQAVTLSLNAVFLNMLAMFSQTIIGPNSSSTITDEIPHGYTEVFFYLSLVMTFISFVSFFSGYWENMFLQRLSTCLSALTLFACIGLAIFNQLVSALILSKMATEDGEDTI
jgi:hypothetical protein